jgi:L-glyceraldehyde 3-phosphate reductase
VAALPSRPLGASGLEVSALALGSWRTYERLPRERGVAVMREARERGITFLDDARYDDETGSAPLATGYSEVVFGELFRAAGWPRDEVVVSNKLWWEFWPEQTAAEELDGSLGRMAFDHLDLVYAERPPDGLALPELVESVTGLIAAGKARAWGVLNWQPAQLAEAARIAGAAGLPGPCAAQLPYSLVHRRDVENETMVAALESTGAGVVASAVLAYGALTGKYVTAGASGRIAAERDSPRFRRALAAGERLRSLSAELDTTPARLALAFALSNPRVSSVLFGATTPEQVAENAGAAELLEMMTEEKLARLSALGAG